MGYDVHLKPTLDKINDAVGKSAIVILLSDRAFLLSSDKSNLALVVGNISV